MNNIESREDFRQKLNAFESKVNAIKLNYVDSSEPLLLHCGDEIAYINKTVKINFCSLDSESDKRTVINVIMDKDGYILPHFHDRVEVIFVLEGKIKDKHNNIITPENNLYVIPAGQIHHLIALERSLLTVTWKPKYIENEN